MKNPLKLWEESSGKNIMEDGRENQKYINIQFTLCAQITNQQVSTCLTVPVGGAQEVLCVTKVISMDLHCQILYEAGVKISKMISWENFEKTQF